MKRMLPLLGVALILTGLGMMGTPTLADAEPVGGLPACVLCKCKTVKIFGNPDEKQDFGGEEGGGGCAFCDAPWHKFTEDDPDGRGIKNIDTYGGCLTVLSPYTRDVIDGMASPVCAPRTGGAEWLEGMEFNGKTTHSFSNWDCEHT